MSRKANMNHDEHADADQFEDDPVSIFRDGKFYLVYPDGTEVEEKPKTKKQLKLEAMDRLRNREED